MRRLSGVGGVVFGEGGYQEFSLGPEIDWLPVVLALVVGAVIGGAAVAWYLRRRTPQRPVLVPPAGERAEPLRLAGQDEPGRR